MRLFVCLLLALLAACAPETSPLAPTATDLRAGGYILYLRHAQTLTASESALRDFSDCSWQRNLSPHGREQAATLGRHLRAAGFTAATVEASPFCRTRETAELVFGRPPALSPDLVYHASLPPEFAEATAAKLEKRLARWPPEGGNLVLVGHAPAMRDAARVELPEGQGVIVQPAGDGSFRVVARIGEGGITRP